jgi:hypothetical protein
MIGSMIGWLDWLCPATAGHTHAQRQMPNN